jgi:Na+/phosphate symporter
MPEDRRLLSYLAKNCLMGIAAGWLLLAALIRANVAQLGDLLFGNGLELTGLVLLAAGFAVTFGSLAMGTAIFLLPRD